MSDNHAPPASDKKDEPKPTSKKGFGDRIKEGSKVGILIVVAILIAILIAAATSETLHELLITISNGAYKNAMASSIMWPNIGLFFKINVGKIISYALGGMVVYFVIQAFKSANKGGGH